MFRLRRLLSVLLATLMLLGAVVPSEVFVSGVGTGHEISAGIQPDASSDAMPDGHHCGSCVSHHLLRLAVHQALVAPSAVSLRLAVEDDPTRSITLGKILRPPRA